MYVISCAVGGVVFKRRRNQMVTKCLYNFKLIGLVWLVLAIYSELFTHAFT